MADNRVNKSKVQGMVCHHMGFLIDWISVASC